MKKFTVTIEETVTQDFKVEAETAEEALRIAEEKYSDGEFVLEPGEVIAKKVAITSPTNRATEWREF